MYVTSPNHFFDAAPIHVEEILENDIEVTSAVRTFSAGSILFREGDPSDYVYEVIEGVLRSSKILCDGRRQIISFGYPGDILGISHNCIYHSDCEAISPVKVRIHYLNVCSTDFAKTPDFCDLMLKHTASEMNNMQEHFMMLGRKSAIEKVASFLSVLMDRVGNESDGTLTFDLPMSRSDIADFLGLTIETVSRTLTALRKRGVIELPSAHQVIVLKRGALRSCAEQEE